MTKDVDIMLDELEFKPYHIRINTLVGHDALKAAIRQVVRTRRANQRINGVEHINTQDDLTTELLDLFRIVDSH